MEVSATGKYIRVSPRKLTLLVRGIKHLSPQQALAHLEFIQKSGASALSQVIASAVSNAKQQNVEPTALVFDQIQVTPGGALKRFRAVSRGMAHEYKKRMSHVKVVLTETKNKNDVKNDKLSESESKDKSKISNPKSEIHSTSSVQADSKVEKVKFKTV